MAWVDSGFEKAIDLCGRRALRLYAIRAAGAIIRICTLPGIPKMAFAEGCPKSWRLLPIRLGGAFACPVTCFGLKAQG
jgi:hypothetical protein